MSIGLIYTGGELTGLDDSIWGSFSMRIGLMYAGGEMTELGDSIWGDWDR